ncbi:fibronectin type III domain-containing protein [Candidatus Enterococcus ferrettii]|uniref:Fibronectin type-III domain-containing protein n=1 Tax=Candidatus Enterococcus ferrettii TaxID=2815324 RepID=A0ABV0EKX6_9ENTE|nr:fibronectin type III domain-containing protein [Enterococcus sp. 665A]MBO1340908.1 hypothetical protein [Enterococcus sp. 665A]
MTKRTIVVSFSLGLLLINSLTSPVLALTTEESMASTSSTSETRTNSSVPSSSIPEETSAASSSEEETEAPQEEVIESAYDERSLNEEAGTDKQPWIKLDEKELAESFMFKGSIHAGSEQSEGKQSETTISNLALQLKKGEKEWATIDTLSEVTEEPKQLQQGPLEFQFLGEQSATEKLEYRLIVDYQVATIEENEKTIIRVHKAQYLLGDIEEETKTSETIEPPLKEAPQMPSREEFKQGARERVLTRAVADVIYYGEGGHSSRVIINNITKNRAYINFESLADYGITKYWCQRNLYIIYSTDRDFMSNIRDANPSSTFLAASECQRILDSPRKSISKVYLPYSTESRFWASLPLEGLEPNQTYYAWPYFGDVGRASSSDMRNDNLLPFTCFVNMAEDPRKTRVPFQFKTEGTTPLSFGAPTFDQSFAGIDNIKMNGGSYSGDISQTPNDGYLFTESFNNNGSSDWTGHGGVQHTTGTGGTYSEYTARGLDPGTRYRGWLQLKNYTGGYQLSDAGTFYTVNTVNPPDYATLNTPTTSTNATAAVSGRYNGGERYGQTPAHPNAYGGVEVQVSTDNWNWQTVNQSTTPAVDTPVVDTANKRVNFNLSKLNTKTTYYVRYRVKNASTRWSEYSGSKAFTTKGIALSVSKPVFNQSTATATSIVMNGGSYSGDISQTPNDGTVFTESWWLGPTTSDWTAHGGVQHTTGTGGTYSAHTVTGLDPGTEYRGWINFTDYDGQYLEPIESESKFYTANAVNQPAVPNQDTPPTTSTNATVSFSAEYSAGGKPGQTAAHPFAINGVKVEVAGPDGVWRPVDQLTTPAVDTPVVDTASKHVRFNLSKLTDKTTYQVRYKVLNASTKWSEFSTPRSFTTKGIELVVAPPVFDQSTATATTIRMKKGHYTGDISQNSDDGAIHTMSYTNGPDENDWTTRMTNLWHQTSTNGEYTSATVTGLTPGTRYEGWVTLYDYEGVDRTRGSDQPRYFYTKNTINELSSPTLNTPTTNTNATAEFTAGYQAAGDHEAQPAAHPNQVQVLLKKEGDTDWTEVSETSSPRLESFTITEETKSIRFKLNGLKANQKYYVRYRVVNQGGASEYSGENVHFTTRNRTAGLFLSQAPSFNFGVQEVKETNSQVGLYQDSVQSPEDPALLVENVGIDTNWSLSAKMSPLKTEGGGSELTGAAITFDKKLQQTTDDVNWTDVTNGAHFLGIAPDESEVVLMDNDASVLLWKSLDTSASQGTYRNLMDFQSVKLTIPGGLSESGKLYEGKVTWTMDVTL